jgi:predicted nucleic acid-binding protein
MIVGEYLEKLLDLGHPKERAVQLITYIMGAFTQISITTDRAPVRPTDPDDEVFLLCAIDGKADFLISNDKSLLTLKSQYEKPTIGNSKDLIGEFCPEV